jgi:glycosyltransferase involved in cell wall biosynthesis
MNILLVHNYYQQRGGEEQIFETEASLLEANGHQVTRYTLNNQQVSEISPLKLAGKTLWNQKVYQEIKSLIRDQKPQVAHFHNTFPLVSPAAYYAARDEGVAVVQTLHNYRLLCPNGLFFRQGRVCEDCLNKPVAFPGVVNRCYRGSLGATSVVATLISLHKLLGTWNQVVDRFIAYSDFAMKKFIQGGLAAEKIEFKTNFLHPAPQAGEGKGKYAVFVGRLSVEKGLEVMLEAWRHLGGQIPLKIIGDGPMCQIVARAAQEMPEIEWLGRLSLQEVYQILGNASFLVFPSEWYETFGRVTIEAFAKGTPVVASNIGAIGELVDHGRTGLVFEPGSSIDLAAKIQWLLAHPQDLMQMRQAARFEFESKYTAEENHRRLLNIYGRVLKN